MAINANTKPLMHPRSKIIMVMAVLMSQFIKTVQGISQAAQTAAGTAYTQNGRQPASEQAAPEDDCVQRMLRWVTQSHGGNNVTIVASIATLGLVISTGLVACGLAVWLCGVGWRAARGPGAQPSDQPSVGREDSRTRVECSRTRNPQRKGSGAGMFVRSRRTPTTAPTRS